MKVYPVKPGNYFLTTKICHKCGSAFYIQGVGILHCSNERCNTSIINLTGINPPKLQIAAIVHLKKSAIS